MIAPDSKRHAVRQVVEALDVSERRACQVIGQPRSTQRYDKQVPDNEELLRQRIIELASQHGRYGYRRVTALLRTEDDLYSVRNASPNSKNAVYRAYQAQRSMRDFKDKK